MQIEAFHNREKVKNAINELASFFKSDEFDLHIAESFNIPLQSLDEQKSHAKEETTNIEGQLTEKASRLEAVTVNPQPKKINHEKAAKDVKKHFFVCL